MQKFSDKFLLTAGSSFFNRKVAFVCQQEWERKLEKRKKGVAIKNEFCHFLPFW
jgi:hypothetical protein